MACDEHRSERARAFTEPVRESSETPILIERWMIDDLGLKGTGAIVYALVWGAGVAGLTASLPKVGFLAGVSQKAAKRTLRNLCDKGLIETPATPANPCAARTWRAAMQPVPLDYDDR